MRGVLRHLERWRGYTSADDTWLRLDELAHCLGKVAEYDAACTASPHGRRRRPLACAGPAAPRRAGAGAPHGSGSSNLSINKSYLLQLGIESRRQRCPYVTSQPLPAAATARNSCYAELASECRAAGPLRAAEPPPFRQRFRFGLRLGLPVLSEFKLFKSRS